MNNLGPQKLQKKTKIGQKNKTMNESAINNQLSK